jgi:hypothetical protein
MRQQLNLVLRRLSEVVLVLLLAATGLALARGHISATSLGAATAVIIATSVALDQLNRGRNGRCAHRADTKTR